MVFPFALHPPPPALCFNLPFFVHPPPSPNPPQIPPGPVFNQPDDVSALVHLSAAGGTKDKIQEGSLRHGPQAASQIPSRASRAGCRIPAACAPFECQISIEGSEQHDHALHPGTSSLCVSALLALTLWAKGAVTRRHRLGRHIHGEAHRVGALNLNPNLDLLSMVPPPCTRMLQRTGLPSGCIVCACVISVT